MILINFDGATTKMSHGSDYKPLSLVLFNIANNLLCSC